MSAEPKEHRVRNAQFAAATREGLLPAPVTPEIAFAGRSNVGKSTLLNALMRRKGLARTSSTPGCTRGIVLFDVELADGANIRLADLPGYGYAQRSKAERAAWAPLIEDYLLSRPTLRGVVLLIDARRGIEEDDRDLLELVASPARTSRPPLVSLIAATKLDKLPASARKLALQKLRGEIERPVLGFSIEDEAAPSRFWKSLRDVAGVSVPGGSVS